MVSSFKYTSKGQMILIGRIVRVRQQEMGREHSGETGSG